MNGIDRCVWLSIRPGRTKQSVASMTVAPSGASTRPTAAIVSPSIRTSPANSPSAVTIVPLAIRVVSLTACLLEVGGPITAARPARLRSGRRARPGDRAILPLRGAPVIPTPQNGADVCVEVVSADGALGNCGHPHRCQRLDGAEHVE